MPLLLFCYDGSDGSADALSSTHGLLEEGIQAVVLTIWQPVALRMASSGGFGMAYVPEEAAIDEAEAERAQAVADAGVSRAREHGYLATSRVERGDEGIARCGRRTRRSRLGRGTLRTALLGSVSHELAGHAHRPVLVAPEMSASGGAAS